MANETVQYGCSQTNSAFIVSKNHLPPSNPLTRLFAGSCFIRPPLLSVAILDARLLRLPGVGNFVSRCSVHIVLYVAHVRSRFVPDMGLAYICLSVMVQGLVSRLRSLGVEMSRCGFFTHGASVPLGSQ